MLVKADLVDGTQQVRGLRTESHALADTDEDSAADEAPEVMPRSEGLHEGGGDGE